MENVVGIPKQKEEGGAHREIMKARIIGEERDFRSLGAGAAKVAKNTRCEF